MGASAPNSSRRIGPRTVLIVAFNGLPRCGGITRSRTTDSYHAKALGVAGRLAHFAHTGTPFPAARSTGSPGAGVCARCASQVALSALLSFLQRAPTYWIAARRASFAESRPAKL